jgi:hypothetical protein
MVSKVVVVVEVAMLHGIHKYSYVVASFMEMVHGEVYDNVGTVDHGCIPVSLNKRKYDA